jgi:hypothetical protein
MLKLETRAHLEQLVTEGLEESLVLEYKACAALDRQSKQIDELCKDVSAMANSAGGQIVYGIIEDKTTHKPEKIDEVGVADTKITPEWIEQVLLSRIQPRLQKLSIIRIPLDKRETKFAYVIAVEATTTGPHQAPDKKYYRRFELSSVPMEDYEIGDVARRATTPQPVVTLNFASGNTATLEISPGQDISKPVALIATLGNLSPEPAYYTIVTIGIDASIIVRASDAFRPLGIRTEDDGHRLNFFRFQIGIPTSFPIFREALVPLDPTPLLLLFRFGPEADESLIRCKVQTPGFTSSEDWTIRRVGGRVTLSGPRPAGS